MKSSENRERTLLDAGWLFYRGEAPTNSNPVSAPAYDDSHWAAINLPHDYLLDGTYNKTNERDHGYLPVPTAWYRKHLAIPKSDEGKSLQLQFDGVFRDSDVWLNGQHLGHHISGFTGFEYDITKVANYGGENILAVHVDPRQFEGWWYEGGGIYRHVYLKAEAPMHVAPFGVQVISEVPNGNKGASETAEITVNTTVTNTASAPANCRIVSEILGPHGAVLATVQTNTSASANGRADVNQHCTLPHPQLWSLESPNLYQVRTTVWRENRPVDVTSNTFGIRTIYYDAEKGFFLNGKHVKIYGVANHQDFPCVGIAVPDSLQAWRVTQLKQGGANAWRTAHNPPNEAVLDACDRLGMLVMDENRHLGDSYHHHSSSGAGYTNLQDLAWMIQRDRNHPSIIMWSMCNEEWKDGLQGSEEGARIFTNMMNVVHKYDRTRPITSAVNGGFLNPGFTSVEDIIGINYNPKRYDDIHKGRPGMPMFGSETANQKSARGIYFADKTNGWVSSYNLTDPGWKPVAEREYMAGSFTWTGFDYKGEPNPDGWPDVGNNTGLLDCCGFPKDKFYYLKSWWTKKPMVHLMPMNWNWPDKGGQTMRVIAFSNAKQVELFLNDWSYGIQTMPQDGHLEWKIPYVPSRLEAKAYTDGHLVATDVVETVDAPAKIELSTSRRTLQADGEDTIVVAVSILDRKGRLVPYANNRVTFNLAGGHLLGAANGNPSDHDPDRANHRNAFNGHCIAVLQAGTKPETMKLTASSPGLTPASISFRVK